ncbi:hypothetical protein DPMN_142938 [Dreissena polymorpha]|uniref:Uncharacterized protein n=1 Tax=Dreissena polymorpha TaxID=45954 RepID=A0A9D4GF97_DREPO|nr:hypothetical protein DPMN_142938 [Dreissena polymorpha]
MLIEIEMPVVIFACCVLHNFILQRESNLEHEVNTVDQIDVDAAEAEGNGKTYPEAENKRGAIAQKL